MKRKVDIKTVAVLSFQLIIIMGLAWYGTTYVNKLASSSMNIIKDNLRSVEYCDTMQRALYKLHSNANDLQSRIAFENNLQEEQNNITETGERESAAAIKDEYFQWLKTPSDSIYSEMISNINKVNELNISAIEKKNADAQQVADSANKNILTVSLLGAVAALLFTFMFIGQFFNSTDQ